MRKNKTDGLRDFQYIDKLNGDFDKDMHNTYKGVRIDFLKGLYGENWMNTYNNIYGDDREAFLTEWQFELEQWNEYEE